MLKQFKWFHFSQLVDICLYTDLFSPPGWPSFNSRKVRIHHVWKVVWHYSWWAFTISTWSVCKCFLCYIVVLVWYCSILFSSEIWISPRNVGCYNLLSFIIHDSLENTLIYETGHFSNQVLLSCSREVCASFGGLQLMLRGDPSHCVMFAVDQKLFLLIRKLESWTADVTFAEKINMLASSFE